MTNMTRSAQIINELIEKHKSAREFSRIIGEDISNVIRWRKGKNKISLRATLKIAEMFNIDPHDLKEETFPDNMKFVFEEQK